MHKFLLLKKLLITFVHKVDRCVLIKDIQIFHTHNLIGILYPIPLYFVCKYK